MVSIKEMIEVHLKLSKGKTGRRAVNLDQELELAAYSLFFGWIPGDGIHGNANTNSQRHAKGYSGPALTVPMERFSRDFNGTVEAISAFASRTLRCLDDYNRNPNDKLRGFDRCVLNRAQKLSATSHGQCQRGVHVFSKCAGKVLKLERAAVKEAVLEPGFFSQPQGQTSTAADRLAALAGNQTSNSTPNHHHLSMVALAKALMGYDEAGSIDHEMQVAGTREPCT